MAEKRANEKPGGYRIMDLESTDRPRERLAEAGAKALSEAELIAILLRVGLPGENAVQLAQRLLLTFGGLRGLLQASFIDFTAVHGLGPAKSAQLTAAIELGRRISRESVREKPGIHSPRDAADLLMYELSGLDHEELWVLLLDTRNCLIHDFALYKGSLNASTVRVGELFKAAIQRNAAAIILAHNHPSGDPNPSPEDATLTRAAVQAGKLLDVSVLDHIVIGAGRFVSMKERGLGFDT